VLPDLHHQVKPPVQAVVVSIVAYPERGNLGRSVAQAAAFLLPPEHQEWNLGHLAQRHLLAHLYWAEILVVIVAKRVAYLQVDLVVEGLCPETLVLSASARAGNYVLLRQESEECLMKELPAQAACFHTRSSYLPLEAEDCRNEDSVVLTQLSFSPVSVFVFVECHRYYKNARLQLVDSGISDSDSSYFSHIFERLFASFVEQLRVIH
jgi:hypothetical protein